MRLPRSRPALEALQWFGLFGGPAALIGEHVIGVGSTFAACNPASQGWTVGEHTYQLTAMAVSALVIVAAETSAVLVYAATKDVEYEDDPPPGRMHFLAVAAMVIGPVLLALVLLSGLGAYVHDPCRQA
jgi:hypothetical protein